MSHSIDKTVQALTSPMPPNAQLESPLFGKFPAELRALLYSELFGGRRVHLGFHESWQTGDRARWRHAVCGDGPDLPFSRLVSHEHGCLIRPRRQLLDTSLLWTCRRAFLEGIPILYQSNVFFLLNDGDRRTPADDIRSFQARIPRHWPLIRSLEVQWPVHYFHTNPRRMQPHADGRDMYEAFWDALSEWPALSCLRIAVLLLPDLVHPDFCLPAAEMPECYLRPILRLKRLKTCEVVMHASYRPIIGPDAWPSLGPGADGCRYSITYLDEN